MDRSVWVEARAKLAEMERSAAVRALAGEGPLFEAMLDERARILAEPVPALRRESADRVLVMDGTAGQWALELTAVARVEPLGPCTPVPGWSAPVMGLTILAADRYLLLDVDGLAANAASPRPLDRPGHAVALRGGKVALAVDRAVGIRRVPPPAGPSGHLVRGVLEDGVVLLDAAVVAARVLGRGEVE